jgi:hypothetical protein
MVSILQESDMQIGQYGTFNNVFHILLELRGNKALIINSGGIKKQVLLSNFEPRLGNVCRLVYLNGHGYLITKSKLIISRTTSKFMKWGANHPVRLRLLGITGIESCKEVMKGQIKLGV